MLVFAGVLLQILTNAAVRFLIVCQLDGVDVLANRHVVDDKG